MDTIKDCLHNLSMGENKDITPEQVKYYKGLIVGIVSALMGDNSDVAGSWGRAAKVVIDNLPDDCIPLQSILPDTWYEGFMLVGYEGDNKHAQTL